ncbi:MAG: hypothetical protein HY238_28370 [Acidobacteria bacterium]|nr:hypothetical protein [Acidobacteriota bacterium]
MTRRQFLAAASCAALRPRRLRAAGSKLRAGAATANITPLLGCSLAGGMTDRISSEVHDELHVRSLVLDNGNSRLAFAVVDSCAVPRSIIDPAKEMIRDLTGIPVSHILVSATHTHSAPPAGHLFQSVPDPKYTDWLAVRIADSVRLAINRLEPARIGWAVGREERLVFNRRYFMKPGTIPPDPFGRSIDRVQMNPPVGSPNIVKAAGPTDPDAGVVAVESLDGRPLSVLGNYALHYVGGGGGTHITADYFGAWARSLRRLAGASFVPILSNGCSGNINGVNFLGQPVRLPPYYQMQQYADILAAECYRTWRTIRFEDTIELAATIEELDLGVRFPGPDDVAAARKILAAAGPGPYKERPPIYARETVILSETYPKTVRTPIQAFRIGSLGIATYPGEAFVELGLEAKAKSPFRTTLLIELANDYRGYIPTVEGHELGGYETWRAKSSYLEREAGPKLVAAVIRGLGKLV